MNKNQNKWSRRDKKMHNRKHGMRVSGRSVFTSVEVKVKKATKVANKKSGGK